MSANKPTEMARSAGLKERAAVFKAAPAVWNAFYENRDAARRQAETALKAFDGREVNYAAGFALGLAGEGARAEALAAKLDKLYPEDTQVQATYVPTLRALAPLDRRDPEKAMDVLEANRRYEFGLPPWHSTISTATCTPSMSAVSYIWRCVASRTLQPNSPGCWLIRA